MKEKSSVGIGILNRTFFFHGKIVIAIFHFAFGYKIEAINYKLNKIEELLNVNLSTVFFYHHFRPADLFLIYAVNYSL